MTSAEARELCRCLYLETMESLQVGPRLRKAICLRNGVLEVGEDSYPLSRFQAIRMVSFGKAAIEMAETAAEILKTREQGTGNREQEAGKLLRGIVVAPGPAHTRLPGLEYFQAGHPYPDEQSWRAAEAVLAFLEKCSPNELVLFLISGGGSALLEKPLDPSVSLEDLRRFHEALVTCGASIEEINILRKHFSAVKGGRLAALASPAAQVTLYVSDVPEHLPSAVASGPTMPDESTVEDCRRIAAQYGLLEKFPDSIRALLESGQLPETPKPGHPSFARSRYYCLLSNRDGIEKLLELARARGVWAEADASCDEWQFQRAADYLLTRLETLRQQHMRQSVLLASGGELSSPVSDGGHAGRGGRNQAFVLHCVPKIAGQAVVVLSAGTDGIDGNSPAAGSIADGTSADRAAALGLDPEKFLCQGDSYRFFEKLSDAIFTGPTGTNVRDLRILLAYS
jgi:glycerate 2-kinase